MKKAMTLTIVTLALTGYFSLTHAQPKTSVDKKKLMACATCHGIDGNGSSPLIPKISGQPARYLAKQLQDFKSSKRVNPVMTAMAAGLSDADIKNLSAHYASQKIAFPSKGEVQYLDEDEQLPVTAEMVAAGKKLFRAGNRQSGMPACTSCHGILGTGNEPAGFPVLRGQYSVYVVQTLVDFKRGKRANDPGAMMQTVARAMSEEELHALAAYISTFK